MSSCDGELDHVGSVTRVGVAPRFEACNQSIQFSVLSAYRALELSVLDWPTVVFAKVVRDLETRIGRRDNSQISSAHGMDIIGHNSFPFREGRNKKHCRL